MSYKINNAYKTQTVLSTIRLEKWLIQNKKNNKNNTDWDQCEHCSWPQGWNNDWDPLLRHRQEKLKIIITQKIYLYKKTKKNNNKVLWGTHNIA